VIHVTKSDVWTVKLELWQNFRNLSNHHDKDNPTNVIRCWYISRRGHDPMVVGFTTTCVISTLYLSPLIVVSLNPVHGEVYSIQHYVIIFVSDFRLVSGFPRVQFFSSTNKTDCHNITEILLKVTLNTINQTTKRKPKHLYFKLGWICLTLSISG
jgi:hypothetical protein